MSKTGGVQRTRLSNVPDMLTYPVSGATENLPIYLLFLPLNITEITNYNYYKHWQVKLSLLIFVYLHSRSEEKMNWALFGAQGLKTWTAQGSHTWLRSYLILLWHQAVFCLTIKHHPLLRLWEKGGELLTWHSTFRILQSQTDKTVTNWERQCGCFNQEFDQQNKTSPTIFVQQTGKWTKQFQTSLRLKRHKRNSFDGKVLVGIYDPSFINAEINPAPRSPGPDFSTRFNCWNPLIHFL